VDALDRSDGRPPVRARDVGRLRPGRLHVETFDLFKGLRSLTNRGIVIWATTAGRGVRTETYPRPSWPLHLSTFLVYRGWEGQPAPNCSSGCGRQPSAAGTRRAHLLRNPAREQALLARAPAELERLLLPVH